MNKEIITEISRIHQLMGTSLIIEAVGGFKSIADEILTYVSKKAGKFGDDVTDLVRKLKNATNEGEITKLIGELINANEELARIYLPKIMALIPDNEAKQIIELKKAMKFQLDGGVPLDNVREQAKKWIDKSVITPLDGIKNIYKKELDDYLTSITKPPTPPTPIKPKPKTVTDVAGQTFDDVTPLTSKDLASLEKMYRQKGLGSSFFKAMRQFSKFVKDMMSSSVTLMDETLSLIKEFSETTNAATKADLGRRIGDNLNTLTQKELVNKKIIDEWIDTNVLDYKIKGKIQSLEGYKKAANLYDNTALKEWQQNYQKLSDRRGKLLKQLNSMINPASWFGNNINKFNGSGYWSKVGNKWSKFFEDGFGGDFGELKRWLITGQTQKWEGIKEYAKIYGPIKAGGNVTKEMLRSYILLTAFYSTLDYLSDFLGNELRDSETFNDYVWMKNQIQQYDRRIGSSTDSNTGYAPLDGLIDFIPDVVKVFWENLFTADTAIPGFTDDFFAFYDWFREAKISKETIEDAKQRIESTKPKVKKAIEKTENVEAPKIELTSKIIYEKHPCYLTNDKGQVADTSFGEDGIEIESPTNFKYKFIDDPTIWNITLKNDGKLYFDDGLEFTCPPDKK
jgi:hypothetical protein